MNMEIANNNNFSQGATGINLASMNKQQLDNLVEKINDYRYQMLSKEMEEIKNKQEKQEENLEYQRKELDENIQRAKSTEKRIDVIGFGIHSKKCKVLQNTCCGRVHSILGDISGVNYILWARYFYKAIYSDLASLFEVDTYKNIHIDNYDQAKGFATTWRPAERYIFLKTQELIERKAKGNLTQIRCMALSSYLEVTDGGTINPF